MATAASARPVSAARACYHTHRRLRTLCALQLRELCCQVSTSDVLCRLAVPDKASLQALRGMMYAVLQRHTVTLQDQSRRYCCWFRTATHLRPRTPSADKMLNIAAQPGSLSACVVSLRFVRQTPLLPEANQTPPSRRSRRFVLFSLFDVTVSTTPLFPLARA